jgi:hypothetical protein
MGFWDYIDTRPAVSRSDMRTTFSIDVAVAQAEGALLDPAASVPHGEHSR